MHVSCVRCLAVIIACAALGGATHAEDPPKPPPAAEGPSAIKNSLWQPIFKQMAED